MELSNDTLRHLDLIVDLAAPQASSQLQILASDVTPAAEEEEETTTTTEVAAVTDAPEAPAAPVEEAIVEPEPVGPPPGAPGFAVLPVSYTAPSAPSVVTIETPKFEPSPAPAPVLPGALGKVEQGLRTALASPGKFLALLLTWGVMAIPVYLAARRRLVTDHILQSVQGVS